ncbi:MAG: hypothetical protein IJU03_01240 [Thermoguttaceae bacterium]|nr:hypothetical protein [Thermoguttaceae bacterium]
MKLFKRFYCALLVCAPIIAILALAARATTSAAEPNNPVFATVTIASLDDLQTAVSKVAEKLERQDMANVIFELARSQKYVALLDPEKPITIAFATNGDTVAPFVRVPLTDFEPDALDALKGLLEDRLDEFELELRVSDAGLYVGQKALMDFILSIPEEKLNIAPSAVSERAPLFAFDLNLTNAPEEILEAGASALRLKLAEGLSELEDDEQINQLDQIFDYLFDVFECVETMRVAFTIDESCAFVATFAASVKEGSFLADELERSQQTPTRWSALTSLPNSIYGTISTGVVSERDKELTKNAYAGLPELWDSLDELDVIVDDPENYELAKELLELLQKSAEKDGELDVNDSGLAILARPAAIIAGSVEASTEELREALGRIAARLQAENAKFNDFIALDAEKIDDFDVSKITIPMSEFCDLGNYADKSIAIRAAFAKDAVVLAIALADQEGKELDDLLAQVLAATKSPAPQPTDSILDLSQLAVLAQDILTSLSDEIELTDEAIATLKCVSENHDAKIVFSSQYADNLLKMQMTASGSIVDSIKAIVDNIEEAKLEDSGQDVDDLFDEE